LFGRFSLNHHADIEKARDSKNSFYSNIVAKADNEKPFLIFKTQQMIFLANRQTWYRHGQYLFME